MTRALLRIVVTVALLGLALSRLDLAELGGRLVGMDPAWVALFLLLSVVQMALSAWRWRYTAGRLALELPFAPALREYYLATLLNQLLPGGVAGDVSRAWRHARDGRGEDAADVRSRAIHAVVIERAAGQVVMLGAAAVSVAGIAVGWRAAAILAAGLALGGVAVARRGRRDAAEVPGGSEDSWKADGPARPSVRASTRRALFSPRPFAIQMSTSALVVASYLVGMVIAARAVGATVPAVTLLPLVAPILVAMLIPLSVGGWGLREGGAALVFGWVGLSPEEGIAISIAYGVLVLLSALPGVVPLARRRRSDPTTAPPEGPDRRGDRAPA